jgi:hypothetical protein
LLKYIFWQSHPPLHEETLNSLFTPQLAYYCHHFLSSMSPQKRHLVDGNERPNKKRQAFEEKILPPGLETKHNKRNLDEDEDIGIWQGTKRQAMEISILPSHPLNLVSRKRHLDDLSNDGEQYSSKRPAPEASVLPNSGFSSDQSRKRPVEEVDDTYQAHVKRRALDLPVDGQDAGSSYEDKMALYTNLARCQTWDSCCQVLNKISEMGEHVLALGIIYAHEEFRLRALKQLGSLSLRIVHVMSQIQIDKTRHDPKGLFPCIATNEFLDTLPLPLRKCNICNERFEQGYDFVKKGCGAHGMHRQCLMESLMRGNQPLWGLCGCLQRN